VTGETVAFGYEASGLASRDCFLATFDAAGAITHEARFELPYVSMIHDMAITREHVIIPGGGFMTGVDFIKSGKPHWGWDSTLPSYFGVMARDSDGSDIRWFKGPQHSSIHERRSPRQRIASLCHEQTENRPPYLRRRRAPRFEARRSRNRERCPREWEGRP